MREKGLATAAATLLVAFATAHLMQFGLSAGRAITGEEGAAPIGLATFVALRGAVPTPDLPVTPPVAPDPAALPFDPPGVRGLPGDAAVPAALASSRTDGFGFSCERSLSLLTEPGAFVEAWVEAPCDAGVRVELDHAGLRFALAIDAAGRAVARIPALMAEATVEAAFADGTVLSARAEVPEAAEAERVALVAESWTGMSLRAGAMATWRGTPTPPAPDGAILRLGDPSVEAPLLAEVYTLPAGRFGALGPVSLRVEVALMAENCARDVGATIVRSSQGVPPAAAELRLALPACDADGGVLVLDLPSPGVRVARN